VSLRGLRTIFGTAGSSYKESFVVSLLRLSDDGTASALFAVVERSKLILPFFVLLLGSCGPNGFHAPLASQTTAPTTTYTPPTSTVGKTGLVTGATTIDGIELTTEAAGAARLTGRLKLAPLGGGALIEIPLDLAGPIAPAESTGLGAAYLSPIDTGVLQERKVEVAAKMMCLVEDCSQYFVNIYVRHNGDKSKTYVHQIHYVTKDAAPAAPAPAVPSTASGQDGVKVADAAMDGSKDNEYEENDGDDDTEDGFYVGETEKDLRAFDEVSKAHPVKAVSPSLPVKGSSSRPSPPPVPGSAGKSAAPVKPAPPAAPATSEATPAKPVDSVKAGTSTSLSHAPANAAAAAINAVNALAQAVFRVDNGHLQNADNLLDFVNIHKDAGFKMINAANNRVYSTRDMLGILSLLGKHSLTAVNNYVLAVGDVAAKNGGKIGSHKSHRTGMDADIGYYFDNENLRQRFTNAVNNKSWMVEEQWELFKLVAKTGNVDRIFIHPSLKQRLCELAQKKGEIRASDVGGDAFEALVRLQPEPSHFNHFHLRLLCSTSQPLCQDRAAVTRVLGCHF
jgi:penicillin-insensitive murein endopeptidase